ncbi:MAG: chondroitin-sulfate-ABC endolyase/exolyase [Crocinitomix sp.]|jgi:chondroitin-sulfate-ABC endolyase/exolyase
MKIFISFITIILLTINGIGQDTELNEIRERYISWLDGNGVDYDRPEVMIRYNYIISDYAWASNYSSFDFDDPGAPWDLTINVDKNELKALTARLIELCIIYNITGPDAEPNPHYEDPEVLEIILSVFDFIEAKGLDGDTDLGSYYSPGSEVYGIGGSSILRSASYGNSILLMRDELLSTGRLDIHLEALDNFSFYWSPENPVFDFVWPGTNADGIKSIGECRLIYVLCQEDGSPDRIGDMEHYLAFLNNALAIAPGWADMIKPDYMTYHHRGPYPSNYGASAIMAASSLEWILDESTYEINAEASSNIREVLLAYRKYTLGYSMPSMVTGRFPTNTEYLVKLTYAFANSYASNPIENSECGQEFTRLFKLDSTIITNGLIKKRGVDVSLYHTLGGMKIMLDILDEDLEDDIVLSGNFSFPYAGMSIHKTDSWMVSQKGTSKHIWHYEGTSNQNVFGRYNSAGYMEILNGNSHSPRSESGLSWGGYNWSHRPGTTVHYLTNDEIEDEVNHDRKFNSKDVLINSDYGNYGAFALDYEDINTDELTSLKKSSFFFDDYVLCLTNNIENTDGIHEVHSTLFQTKILDTNSYTYVGIDSINGLDYSYTSLTPDMGFTDAANNAYYVHNNSDVALNIVRQHQNSISHNGSGPTEGNFTKAWLNHGIDPVDLNLVYCIQVNGGKTGAENLPSDFDDLFEIHAFDDFLHVVKYLPDTTVGIVAYQANDAIDYGYIKEVDNAGVLFTTPLEENKLKVGFTDPHLGLMDYGTWYTYGSFPLDVYYQEPYEHEVTVTVFGKWEIESGSENVTLYFDGTNSELTFTTKNGLSEECILKKPSTVGTGFLEEPNITVYPTITNSKLIVSGELSGVSSIILTDVNGKHLKQWENSNSSQIELDISNYSSGLYFLILDNEHGIFKVIKQ